MGYSLSEDDLAYELDIIKNPDDLILWLKYIEFKQTAPLKQQAFVFERACEIFPRSYKIWKNYLEQRVHHLRFANYKDCKVEFENVIELFEKALLFLNKMPRIWSDYLQFVMNKLPQNKRIMSIFDRALIALPISQHNRIWPLMLKYANIADTKSQCIIWKRYMQFDNSRIEEFINIMIKNKDYKSACEALIEIINDPDFQSTDGKSRFQFWEELIDLLVHQDTPFDTEMIIKSAIERYIDQQGKLWVYLATYFINTGRYDRARDTFEQGIKTAIAIRDFTQLFDSYIEFEETLISKLMGEDDKTVDIRMESFERLMERRPFIINSILLEQDSNNVAEWQKQAELYNKSNKDQQVVETYTKAIETINPAKANNFAQLWISYAKFFENHGNLQNARIIFDKATKVPYRTVNELADIWIEWAEMELRSQDNNEDSIDRAIKVMATAAHGPKHSKVNYFDETLAPQERLHKCMKLWSFYLDLVESGGNIQQIKPLYDRVFELKIATALTVVNYANLLEENNYFEESFRVYERGVEMFNYPVAFELWNVYLQKAMERGLGIERMRDLFEQALENCPSKFSKSIFYMYGKLEEEKGLNSNALNIYSRAVEHVDAKDQLEVYEHYISRIAAIKGLEATRDIFEQAIDILNDADTNTLCAYFISIEIKLGEFDRARGIYTFCAQFNDPDYNTVFWDNWTKFEQDYGNQVSYKEMLRVKREVRKKFSSNVQALASKLHKDTTAPKGFVTAASEERKQSGGSSSPEAVEAVESAETVENPNEIDIDI